MAKFTQNDVWADTLRLTRAHWPAADRDRRACSFSCRPCWSTISSRWASRPRAPTCRPISSSCSIITGRTPCRWCCRASWSWRAARRCCGWSSRSGGTVGGAILFALALLPVYSILLLLVNLAVGAGLMLLIVPGLYLWGRLLPAAPAMVAEERRNPIDALGRGCGAQPGPWLADHRPATCSWRFRPAS